MMSAKLAISGHFKIEVLWEKDELSKFNFRFIRIWPDNQLVLGQVQ